jgi:hypothetical protein
MQPFKKAAKSLKDNVVYFYRIPNEPNVKIVERKGTNMLSDSQQRTHADLRDEVLGNVKNFEENRLTADIKISKGYHTGKFLAYNEKETVFTTLTKNPNLKLNEVGDNIVLPKTEYHIVGESSLVRPIRQYETTAIYADTKDLTFKKASDNNPLEARTQVLGPESKPFDLTRGLNFAMFKKTEILEATSKSDILNVKTHDKPKSDLEHILPRSEGQVKSDGKAVLESIAELKKFETKSKLEAELIQDGLSQCVGDESYIGSKINLKTGETTHLYSPTTSPVKGGRSFTLEEFFEQIDND